jgi:hypothetical protein
MKREERQRGESPGRKQAGNPSNEVAGREQAGTNAEYGSRRGMRGKKARQ